MNVFDVLREKVSEISELARPVGWSRKIEIVEAKVVMEIINQVELEYNNGWIPVSERYPESNTLVLLSFENIDIQMVGMYEEDSDGGTFYLVANGKSCISCDLFVNAWRALPTAFNDDMLSKKQTNGDRIRSMTDEELTKIIMCPYDTAGEPIDIMPCVIEHGEHELVSPEYCNKCMMDWLKME